MDYADEAAKLIAEREARSAGPGLESLVDYAERSRSGDWTLRSALVRLAQPEPVRASAVLEVIRWLDGALEPIRIHIDNHAGTIDLTAIAPQGMPILVALLELDQLAEVLTVWANAGSADAPLERVSAVSGRVADLLEEAGVPRESPPDQRRRRSS